MRQPHQNSGVYSGKHVVSHYTEPAGKMFELTNGVRLQDIEKAKQQESK